MTLNAESLRPRRAQLLKRFDTLFCNIPNPHSFLDFQIAMIEEIIVAETGLSAEDTKEAQRHIRLVRIMGDALAVVLLDPHQRRQLSKNEGTPVRLASQKAGLQHVLDTGKQLADAGAMVLLADATNILRIGDIILYVPRGAPHIIECKTKRKTTRQMLQGSLRRQLQRMLHTQEFMGNGRLTRNEGVLAAVDVGGPTESTFEIVANAVNTALETKGPAIGAASEWDKVLALPLGVDLPENLPNIPATMEAPAAGMYGEVLRTPAALLSTVLNWPVPHAVRERMPTSTAYVVPAERSTGVAKVHVI